MNEITHQQARSLLQQVTLPPIEREALKQHLAHCDRCRQYAAVHAYLSEHLTLEIDVPQLSGEQQRALAARMEQQVRRERAMSQLTAIIRPLAWATFFFAVALVAAGLFSTMRSPAAEPAASDAVAGSAPVTTTRAAEDAQTTAGEATATTFPATMTPPATPGATEVDLNRVDVRGAEARAHPQVSERFSLSVDEAQAAASFPLWLPSRLPSGFGFIGAEVSDGQATFIFGSEGDQGAVILTLEQRMGRPFHPGQDGEVELATVPLAGGEALYLDGEVMAALAWQEDDVAFEWTVAPNRLPLEVLKALATSLVAYGEVEPES